MLLDDEYKVTETEILKHMTFVQKKAEFKRSIVAGGIPSTFKGKKPWVKRVAIGILYGIAVGILIGYGYIVDSKTNDGNLGFLTAIATFVSDVFIFLISHLKMPNGPMTTTFLIVGMRVFLFAFGGDYWFVGYCLLFLLVTITIGWYLATLNLPLEVYKPKKKKNANKKLCFKRTI